MSFNKAHEARTSAFASNSDANASPGAGSAAASNVRNCASRPDVPADTWSVSRLWAAGAAASRATAAATRRAHDAGWDGMAYSSRVAGYCRAAPVSAPSPAVAAAGRDGAKPLARVAVVVLVAAELQLAGLARIDVDRAGELRGRLAVAAAAAGVPVRRSVAAKPGRDDARRARVAAQGNAAPPRPVRAAGLLAAALASSASPRPRSRAPARRAFRDADS
ncbi:MAG: hypothetical protein ACK53T_15185 [Planctomycetota bacterium]